MKVRIVRSNRGRLPKPTGRISADVRRALELYRMMHGPNPKTGRAWHRASWELNGSIQIMSKQELAGYYKGVGGILKEVRRGV